MTADVPPPAKPGMPPSPRFVLSPDAQRRFNSTAGAVCVGGFLLTASWSIASTSVSSARGFFVVEMAVGLVILLGTIACAGVWTLRRWLAGLSVVAPLTVPIVCLALTISVMVTGWPLRAVFACSRGRFEEVAERVRAGETITEPFWIGPFRIVKATYAENGNPVICLWTDLHPYGHTGFARTVPGQSPANQLLNLWSERELDDVWYFVSED